MPATDGTKKQFVPAPEGVYKNSKLEKVELTVNKYSDNQQLRVAVTLDAGTDNEKQASDWLDLENERVRWKLENLFKVFGGGVPETPKKVKQYLEQFVGYPLDVTLKDRTWTGKDGKERTTREMYINSVGEPKDKKPTTDDIPF